MRNGFRRILSCEFVLAFLGKDSFFHTKKKSMKMFLQYISNQTEIHNTCTEERLEIPALCCLLFDTILDNLD